MTPYRRPGFVVRTIACTIALLLLGSGPGCQRIPPAESPGTGEPLPPVPDLPVDGAVLYRIDPGRSDFRILVYRGGPLAEFGHNHVIVAKALRGEVYLAPSFHDSGFRFLIPVADLVVDPPAARRQEGGEFATALSDQAVEKTRENMLGPEVLDAENHPEIRIRSVSIKGPERDPDVTARITLHGVSRDVTVPVAFHRSSGTVTITGATELQQSDFGLIPFSVMGGGLQVRDRLKIRFRITAVRNEE